MEKNRCPFCGTEIYDIEERRQEKKIEFNCPTCNWLISIDDLIDEWSNCAWDY